MMGHRTVRLTAGVAGLALVGAAATLWLISDTVRTWAVTPMPRHVPGMVDALVAVVRGVRLVSPYVTLAALVALVGYAIAPVWSRRARVLNELARMDYAGLDHIEPSRRAHWAAPLRRFLAGTTLSVLAIVLVGATSGVEEEITNGPLRPVDAALAPLADGPVTLVLQGPRVTFMDDSSLPAEDVAALLDRATGRAIPFGKHLFTIDGHSALEISVPDAVYAAMAGRPAPAGCDGATAILDDTLGVATGETVLLNGVPVRVAKVHDGIAQMNRSIALLADSTVRECVQHASSTAYFGVLLATGEREGVQELIDDVGVQASAVSEAAFRENNRDFWRANATPLLLQIILYLALFSAFAAAGERQSTLQRNSREIGMLHAAGVDFRALRGVERRRVLRRTFRAAVIAAPLMIPVAAAFNASELGVQIGIGLTEVSVGIALTLGAMLVASQRSLARFRRTLDLPLAVKG